MRNCTNGQLLGMDPLSPRIPNITFATHPSLWQHESVVLGGMSFGEIWRSPLRHGGSCNRGIAPGSGSPSIPVRDSDRAPNEIQPQPDSFAFHSLL